MRVDLNRGKVVAQEYDPSLALLFLGGRNVTVKILWYELSWMWASSRLKIMRARQDDLLLCWAVPGHPQKTL